MSENRIKDVMEETLNNLNKIINVNTVIGEEIKTEDGDLIIPISKITVAIISGGGEYGKVSIFKNEQDLPYSAGNGSVINIKPTGFLIKEKNNKIKLLSTDDGIYEKLLNKTDDIINLFKGE